MSGRSVMRISLQTAVAVLFVFALYLPVKAEDYSRNCRIDNSADEVVIREGTYNGSWTESVTVTQTIQGFKMTQTFRVEGTFKLRVDKTTPANQGSFDSSTLQGDMRTYTIMDVPLMVGAAGQRLAGSAALQLDGSVSSNTFTAKANHATSGSIFVQTPWYGASRSQSFSDQVKITFRADQAECNGASGTVEDESLNEIAKMAESTGYQVTKIPATWQMTRVEDASDPIRKLREELERKPAAGIVFTRDREAARIGAIADKIREEPRELQDCLWAIWLEHTEKMLQGWVMEDIGHLQGYNGDYQGLMSYAKRALEADRSLCLVGQDTCSEQLHTQLWEALGGALSRYLEKMADGHAPMAHLLEVTQQGELLGVVSPQQQAEVWSTLQKEAQQLADATWNSYQQVLQAAPGTLADRAKNPAVRQALAKALTAEQSAVWLGCELTRAVEESARLDAATAAGSR